MNRLFRLSILYFLAITAGHSAVLTYDENFESYSAVQSTTANSAKLGSLTTATSGGTGSSFSINNTVKLGNYSVFAALTRDTSSDYRSELVPTSKNVFQFNTEYWYAFKVYRPTATFNTDSLYEISPFQIHNVYQDWTTACQLGAALNTAPFNMSTKDGNDRIYTMATPGTSDHIAWSGPYAKDQWTQFVFHFKISQTSGGGGFVEVWKYNALSPPANPQTSTKLFREDKVLSYQLDKCGRPLLAPKLQFGIYKAAWKTSTPTSGNSTRKLYYDDIRIATGADGFNLVTGGSGSADTTAPIISNVAVNGINNNSATITWTTNESSDSKVDYGPTTSYNANQSDAAKVTSHSITLTNLTAGQLYNYRTVSKDAANNSAASGNFTFTTSNTDTQAPTVSNVQTVVTENSIKVTWTTNEPSDSRVELLSPVTDMKIVQESVTSHSLTVINLTPGTTYSIRVSSADAAGNVSLPTNLSATTLAVPADTVISNLQVSLTATSATVTFNTNVPAKKQVFYGPNSQMGSYYNDDNPVTSHTVTLTNLQQNKLYYYRIVATNSVGVSAPIGKMTFMTLTKSGGRSDTFNN